jgi:hypothetical protein
MKRPLETMPSRKFMLMYVLLFIGSGSMSYSLFSFREERGIESPGDRTNLRRTLETRIQINPTDDRVQSHETPVLNKTTATSYAPINGDIRLNAELDFEFYKIANSRKIDTRFKGDKAATIAFLRWLQSSKPELFAGDPSTADILTRYRIAKDVDEKRNLIGELHVLNQRNELAFESVLEDYHRINPPATLEKASPPAKPPEPLPPKYFQ